MDEQRSDGAALDARAMQAFLHRTNDGSLTADADASQPFDFQDFFDFQFDRTHLLLSKSELGWMDTDAKPDRRVPVFVNLSCGTQLAPHLAVETVGILRALGVDFVSASSRQYCCGKIYRRVGREEAGEKMTGGAIDRVRAWGASVVTHGCPSCHIYYSDRIARDGIDGLSSLHITTFLERRLDELGDKVPWRNEVRARVLVEGHGVELSPVHDAVTRSVSRLIAKVPGVEIVGTVQATSLGLACKTLESGVPLLASLEADERRRFESELEAQAAARGADTIVPFDKYCHTEYSKLALRGVAVREYLSILADGLGCAQPDRFQELWRLHDPEQVVERTRSNWESWGVPEAKARAVAFRHFDREHSAFTPKCACGGDSTKCNTGKFTLVKDIRNIQAAR
jgi:hypothetical protein